MQFYKKHNRQIIYMGELNGDQNFKWYTAYFTNFTKEKYQKIYHLITFVEIRFALIQNTLSL